MSADWSQQEILEVMWRAQVANASRDASLVADTVIRDIGARTATRAALRRMTHEATKHGFNRAARMNLVDAMDPHRDALGFPMLSCEDDARATVDVRHLRVLWVMPLLDGVPINSIFDVPESAFTKLPRRAAGDDQ